MLINELKELLGNRLLLNEPMSAHTTFRIGGPADIMLLPSSAEEILACTDILHKNGVPYIIIGKGSNLLVGDKGVRGAVIKLGRNFGRISSEGNMIIAEAGASLASVAALCLKLSLSGFEFAAGIPGTVGGGVSMNAGAYGGELKDIILSVKVLKDNKIINLENIDCGFEYRNSRIMKEAATVLEARFLLEPSDDNEISAKMKELAERRSEKQPLEYPSAGSTFKRPQGYFAGKLIQDCGLKGHSIGGAAVSEKHSGFIVNTGGASAKDVSELIAYIQDKVYGKFGVMLEPEVRFVGEFV